MVEPSPSDQPPVRRLAFQAESDVETRLWSMLFLSRQVGVVAAAIAVLAIPDFGPDRFAIVAVTLLIILPFDVWLQWRTRATGAVPTIVLAQVLLAPAFVLWEPRVWVPAVVGSVAAMALTAMAFRMPVPAILTAVQAALLAGAGAVADVSMYAEALVAFVLVGPPIVVALSAVFRGIVSSEHRYREFLEYANDIVYTHDLTTLKFVTANEAALRVTGYSRQELSVITVADIVAPEDLGRAAEMIQRKVEGDADATTYEVTIVAKDGRRIPVEVSTRVIYRRGEAVAIQGIARDIGERKAVEAQRLALDHARSEFIANAAHELRTPLTTLAGLAAVLASTRPRMSEDEIEEAVQALDRQGRRARLLADRLLNLSSVELGAIDIAHEPVDVGEAVEHALEDAPPPANQSIEMLVSPDVKALGDSLRLQEIVQNLLTNAYRYGGPRVTIGAHQTDGNVVLTVDDDGAGVPEALRPNLFEPFARGDHGDSTGLGLAICARLAQAQGGDISYEPTEPVGTRFSVVLPAAP